MYNNVTIPGYAAGANPNGTPMVLNIMTNSFISFAGSLSLGGPSSISLQNNMTVYGGLTGSGSLQIWATAGSTSFLALAGSSNYTGSKVTVEQGILSLLNGGTSASDRPLGTAAVTVNPGGVLRLAANNLGGALTLNSDSGNLAVLGLAYNPGSSAIPGTFNANGGPFTGTVGIDVVGFSKALDMSTLAGGSALSLIHI